MFLKNATGSLVGFLSKLFRFRRGNLSVTKPRLRHEWSIGIYVGASSLDLAPPANFANPVLTRKSLSDVDAAFVADPFMVNHKGIWHMFFEVMNRQTGKGEIGLATSEDIRQWTFQQIVLEEPFHLSYPYVFKWANEYYMIPETSSINAVRLYKAAVFPFKWSLTGTLLEGRNFSDASPFYFNGRWWLFTGHGVKPTWGTLRLFYADQLAGPWFEHPRSPLIEENPRGARPAGRVLAVGEKIIRYGQDCYSYYGSQVRAFEIVELTTTSYRDVEIENKSPVLAGSGVGWNAAGMHHIDAHRLDDGSWIACVDGFFWQTYLGGVQQKKRSVISKGNIRKAD